VKQTVVLMAAVAVLAATAGYFVARAFAPATVPVRAVEKLPAEAPYQLKEPDDLVGRRRPDFTHRDLTGNEVSAKDFDGAPLLINFWATWCKPCVEEMPMLSRLRSELPETGIQVVGIALDDPERASAFVRDTGVDYPVLVGGTDVVLTGRRYGNRSGMLPFSVLVDHRGIVRWTHLGALDREILVDRIRDVRQ
jgi:thiol-disulfide isomerase/thioredoxin